MSKLKGTDGRVLNRHVPAGARSSNESAHDQFVLCIHNDEKSVPLYSEITMPGNQ